MIRAHTNRSGDVGPVVFELLPTGWIVTSGVSERFPVRRSAFFDELRMFHVGLVDSKRFSPWRQQTGSGLSLVCKTVRDDWAITEKSRPTHAEPLRKTTCGLLLPRRILSGIDCSRNTASKHVQTVGIHYRDTVNMHMCSFLVDGTSKKLSPVGEVNYFRFLTKPRRMNSSTSTLVVVKFLILSAYRTHRFRDMDYNFCHAFQRGKF